MGTGTPTTNASKEAPISTPETAPDPWLQLIHRSDRITTAELEAAAEAVTIQARQHLAPHWDVGENLVIELVGKDKQPSPEAWWLVILDDPDVADALGYHDVTSEGRPLGKAFARPTVDAGLPISGVISHEVLEALVDPRINEWSFDDYGAFYATEVCDAVQGTQYDYQIDGVTVADFVLPSFFHRADRTPPYDHAGAVEYPFQTLPGGYQIRYTRSRGMHQVFGQPRWALLPSAWGQPKPRAGSRRERRARGHQHWQRSGTPT